MKHRKIFAAVISAMLICSTTLPGYAEEFVDAFEENVSEDDGFFFNEGISNEETSNEETSNEEISNEEISIVETSDEDPFNEGIPNDDIPNIEIEELFADEDIESEELIIATFPEAEKPEHSDWAVADEDGEFLPGSVEEAEEEIPENAGQMGSEKTGVCGNNGLVTQGLHKDQT